MINSTTQTYNYGKRDQFKMELSGKLRLYVEFTIFKKQQNMERYKIGSQKIPTWHF